MAAKTITISVRRLVEFILSSGDIDTTHGKLADLEAMQQGGKMHRKLQKEAGPSYKAEVSLKHRTVIDESLEIVVEGRADGIITESEMASDDEGMLVLQDKVTIDEIKGTYTNFGHITEPATVHLAQAKCYAYFYALEEDLKRISVRITYAHLKSHKIKYFTEDFSFAELEVWYDVLIEKFAMWVKWQIEWEEMRNLSVGGCRFPFEYRDSQRKLIAGVYQTIVREKKLFIQAPTGTGKTIATIFPAVQAVGQGMAGKIFYLTAKTIARTVAENTFSILQDKGLRMKVLTLTAKDKICIFDEAHCDPSICPRAKGHYDRVNEAVFDLITHEEKISRECVEAYAAKHNVCPFEMQLDVSLWIDVIICDYNYVFDPDVSLKRFENDTRKDYLYLVDETHNLVDRAREMYSAVLDYSEMKMLRKQLTGVDRKVSGALEKCLQAMKRMKEESDEKCQLTGNIGSFIIYLMKLYEHLEAVLKGEMSAKDREFMTDLYFMTRKFIAAFERSDDRYLTYFLRSGENFKIKISCVDPSKDLTEHLSHARSAIFFSATLLPITYYKEMLSDSPSEDYDLYADSPFDKENRLLLLATDVSSRYTKRGRAEYEKIALYIKNIIRARHGNYMIFFPSYQMMEEVFDVFTEMELMKAGHGLNVVVQESEMSEDARQRFLDEFKDDAVTSTIGFCVLGGIFSEGIDLKEDRLIGAIVVGTGLPKVTAERELLKQYFDETKNSGFEYAYLYPGMNKVLQAGGRVIRTEKDKGVIALLDERFSYSQYKRLFPREWEVFDKTNLKTVDEQVENFWTNSL